MRQATHTHTHPFNGPFSGTIQVSRYQKGNTKLDFCEARDSEWQWHQLGCMQVCTSLQTDNHASTSPLRFLQAGCSSCHPTNSVKALKATVKIQVMFVVSDDFLFFSFSLHLLGRDANPWDHSDPVYPSTSVRTVYYKSPDVRKLHC